MTLCSEMEFEQMEEFLGDHPLDTSVCSQASVVRKFMSRPSMSLKPVSTNESQSSYSDQNGGLENPSTPTSTVIF